MSACLSREGRHKRPFQTKQAAKRFIKRGGDKSGVAFEMGAVHAYKCPDCGAFHVGHKRR